ncbi:ribokinase [Pedobacter sp. BS3]|uniref:ribokinase n=1 Tax=Pedobacter sp. BS3 TaxID=2567937 RepID=UPI001F5B9A2F|nr:ribokinase [Pedobacter sp. BS3]
MIKKRILNMNPMVLVVGSSNTDMVIKADHLPAAGETILGGTFFMNPGGKGANQAVAAARLGGNVTFICKTGNDIFGRQSVQLFEDEGINTSYLLSDSKNPSGVALITVDKDAENCIVVASGANAALNAGDLQKAQAVIEQAAIVLMQLEIPLETVQYVASTAAEKSVKVVLNPAPACELPDDLLRKISIITPNKTEAEMLSGVQVNDMESAKKAARIICDKGVKTVIITLGQNGALVLHEDEFTHVPAVKVEAVDTTAAGDVFNGALVVALSQNKSMLEAVAFACNASAISVTRLGAQSSAPYKRELDTFISIEK